MICLISLELRSWCVHLGMYPYIRLAGFCDQLLIRSIWRQAFLTFSCLWVTLRSHGAVFELLARTCWGETFAFAIGWVPALSRPWLSSLCQMDYSAYTASYTPSLLWGCMLWRQIFLLKCWLVFMDFGSVLQCNILTVSPELVQYRKDWRFAPPQSDWAFSIAPTCLWGWPLLATSLVKLDRLV